MEGNEINQETMTEESQGISQIGMEQSFLDEYQLVDNQGNPIDETVKENEPENVETVKHPVQENKTQQAQPEKTDSAKAVTDYTKDLYKDDGSLDVEKALELFGSKPKEEQAAVQQQIVPQQQRQDVENAKYEENPVDPLEQMRKNALAALELQRYYMNQGDDPQTAMVKAQRDIEDHLNKFYYKSEIDKLREEVEAKIKAKDEEIKNKEEVITATPLAEKNLFKVCSKFAKGTSVETLKNAIYDPNLGGKFLLDLFKFSNPDKANQTGEQLFKSLNDWFVKSCAKSESFVESLAINAVNQIQRLVYPEMVKLIQQNAVARQGVQTKTKPGPRTAQNPAEHKPIQKSSEQHNLDVFFHDVPRETARPHI